MRKEVKFTSGVTGTTSDKKRKIRKNYWETPPQAEKIIKKTCGGNV